ncbi:carbohydrate-binding family 9-like protein [Marinoscillum furvescens]|uniref:Carbohydrate binding protein with CBM9 domain n=1 Tax=Marinoscillum furvescens DSM 4134 TaxID=1122208 RepID=A0A3D9LFU6_MARFU|nr:carbohydrate-binding family 9-like protein [Marinoscillum furvescens]REE05498.1 carbohydrate binding protein with CBM9 domain [Marinoscillum furvescens DSM 4134]
MTVFLIRCLVIIFCMPLACAQPIKTPQTYVAHRTSTALLIDGVGNEADWQQASWTQPFIDIEGVKTPRYQTQVKMLWDDTYFYILAQMEEPHVWADLVKRDTIVYYNNDFEVFVDPDGDTHNYYELEINALNTVWDLFITKPYRNGGLVLNDWDIHGLQSAVKVDGTLNDPSDLDNGWTLEVAIPWKAYRKGFFHQAAPEDQFWRVNFSRVNWDHQLVDGVYQRKQDENGNYLPEYNWVWSPQGVINMHEPEQWGYVYFSTQPVGSDVNFTIPEDEPIKWKLYELYRAHKAYIRAHKKMANEIADFAETDVQVGGESLAPGLEVHSLGWNISMKSPFTGKTLSVREDGKYIETK